MATPEQMAADQAKQMRESEMEFLHKKCIFPEGAAPDQFALNDLKRAEEIANSGPGKDTPKARSLAKHIIKLYACHEQDLLAKERVNIQLEVIVGGIPHKRIRECSKSDLETFENNGWTLHEPKAKRASRKPKKDEPTEE